MPDLRCRKELFMVNHTDHRQRLRAKFAESPEILEDHELLELLLFYSVPRKNTNDTAHLLLKRFGTLKRVLDAGIPALKTVDGVGDQSALFFRVVAETMRRYNFYRNIENDNFRLSSELKKYLTDLFVGTDNETVYLLLFTASNQLISCHKLSEGYSCRVDLSLREILFLTISENASSVVLAHNHPGGKAIPSGEDIHFTHRLHSLLTSINVELVDHYVIAGNECRAIMGEDAKRLFIYESAASPATSTSPCSFSAESGARPAKKGISIKTKRMK